MHCPKCQIENPGNRKFCRECGAKLVLTCPKCQFENIPSDKFCGDCWHDLTLPSELLRKELSFDEKLERIQKYLPSGIAGKILSQRDRIEGEKRQVTVMFCDMKGFTPLSEKLGPKTMYAMMDEVYEILIRKVTEYGGTVNELTGDGVMALFGAPIALEDAPQRAIRASLAIHREMVQFNDRMRREKPGLPLLRMRAGIHTGPVVVGTVGNDLRVDFKAVGDTVNLASRMEQMAEPGATYISEDTFALTEGLFRFEGLGEREVKGKEKPIRIYRVIAASTSRTRFDVSAERGLTPFVGRERERELLLDAFERARSGRGQAVSIVSEAGMGKSRLLYEFRKAILNEDVTFLEGKCLSFSRGLAYQPISDILKSNFDIREGDWDSVIRNKVAQGLQAIAVEDAPAMPYLLELLSVKDSGIEKIQLSPEGKKDRTIETLKKILLKGSELRPLVVAIEDLHWIDKTSEDVLKYFLESIPGARVLLIFTYRTEFMPTWGARSYHNQLLLNRLSNRESLVMVSHMLGTEDVESGLEEVILEKTEGIPFFVEELIKSLKDLGFIERKDNVYRISKELQSIRIPSTIQDIIMARVDALPEGAKEVLQVGSLIEREFSYKLIKAVMKLPEQELLRHLSALKDAELLYEWGLFPDSTFIFKHALTREVLYDSLLDRKKKQLHLQIGKAIEDVHRDALDERYAALADHFLEGGDYAKAAEYFHQAGRRARRASVHKDAVGFARKEVDCIEKLPQTEEIQKKVIDARTTLARDCVNLGYYADAGEAVAPVVDLCHALNYRKRLPAIYVALANHIVFAERYDEARWAEAFRYYEEAARLAREERDYLSLWNAHVNLGGIAYSSICEFSRGESCLKEILAMSETAGNAQGTVIAKSILSFIYVLSGRIDDAMRESHEALQIAITADDPWMKSFGYTHYGVSCFFKGLFGEAEECLKKGLSCAQRCDFASEISASSRTLGDVQTEMGRYGEAQSSYDIGLAALQRTRIFPVWSDVAELAKHAARISGRLGPITLDLRRDLVESRVKGNQGLSAHLIGKIYLHIDDEHMDEAETWIRKAIEADERNRLPWHLAKDYALYTEFFQKKGDIPEAKEQLTKAIDIFRECGADGWVTRTERELASLG